MISDERLRKAAQKVEESMLASLPEPEECEFTPSPEFERKMEKRARRASHPIRHRILKAAACFLLVVLVGGGGILTFSVEARAAFVTWVREVYETQFIYRLFQANEEALDDTVYRPTWVPSDYQMISDSILDGTSSIVYRNTANELAVFTYFKKSATAQSVFQVERDGTESYSQVSINGISADMYIASKGGESNVLIWTDESTGVIFCISAPFDKNELIKMAESVERHKP